MKKWQFITPVMFLFLLSCSSVQQSNPSLIGTSWSAGTESNLSGTTMKFVTSNSALLIDKSNIAAKCVYDTTELKYKIKNGQIVLYPKKNVKQSGWDKKAFPIKATIDGDNLSFTFKKDPNTVFIIKKQK